MKRRGFLQLLTAVAVVPHVPAPLPTLADYDDALRDVSVADDINAIRRRFEIEVTMFGDTNKRYIAGLSR